MEADRGTHTHTYPHAHIDTHIDTHTDCHTRHPAYPHTNTQRRAY